MELELELTPDAAARLPRLRALLGRKLGRAQSRPVRRVWHDGPEAELAKAGLALVETRTHWRLERLRPMNGMFWPPAAPAPLLAAEESLEALADRLAADQPDIALPERMVPWAAFEGRALRLLLRPCLPSIAEPIAEPTGSVAETAPTDAAGTDEASPDAPEAVELTLIDGSIRTVARETPLCRLMISGAAAEVALVAFWLTGEIEASVPTCSAAERALTAARGGQPAPRRRGAPVLTPEMSVAEAFAHVTSHLTDVILHFAPIAAGGERGPEPVHQMRVATRRLRSAVAVFARLADSPEVATADAGLKHLANTLGPARDWDVFTSGTGAAVATAFAEDEAVGKLLFDAERQRLSGYDALRQFVATAEFRQLGVRLALIAAGALAPAPVEEAEPDPAEPTLAEFAARALRRRLKRMFAEGRDIEHLETATLHAIRLRAKRLRYACEFFAPVFPHKATRRFIRRLSVLQERLGTLNDGAVAAELLARLDRTGPGAVSRAFAVGAVRGFVAAQGGAARSEIADAWRKFEKAEPFWD